MSRAKTHPAVPDSFDIGASLVSELRPVPMPPSRNTQLKRHVIERVHRSALAHRELSTVRREDSAWTTTSPGLRQRALSAAGGMRVDVLKLGPHASVPWPQDAHAQEVLVIDGSLELDAASTSPIRLSRLNQVVIGRDEAWRQTAGGSGATLYVRRRTVDLEHLPAGEARWWVAAQDAAAAEAARPSQWSSFIDGADAAVLQACGDVASMLVRIALGATLPDHGHSLDEDCFMLEGDMFLGDILMRAGDYQLAHAGGRHVGISSDMGGLFYFHGAVPPVASESAR
jgi:hypothetical protein